MQFTLGGGSGSGGGGGGSVIVETAYKTIIEEVSETVTYIGQAEPGTSVLSPNWRIKLLSVSGNTTNILYADGTNAFAKIWNNRASYTYN